MTLKFCELLSSLVLFGPLKYPFPHSGNACTRLVQPPSSLLRSLVTNQIRLRVWRCFLQPVSGYSRRVFLFHCGTENDENLFIKIDSACIRVVKQIEYTNQETLKERDENDENNHI